MTKRAEDLGVEFIFDTSAEDLVYVDDKVAGVVAKDDDGKVIKYNAKAVIIATGGIGDN